MFRPPPVDSSGGSGRSDIDPRVQSQLREFERQVGRLRLVNQALWEILSDRAGISEEELREKMKEVDLRDGVLNGQLGFYGNECPACGRVTNSRHKKCMYCGGELHDTSLF